MERSLKVFFLVQTSLRYLNPIYDIPSLCPALPPAPQWRHFTVLPLDNNGHGNSSWNCVQNKPPWDFYHATNEFCLSCHTDNYQYCIFIVSKEVWVSLAFILSVHTKFGHIFSLAEKNYEYIKPELRNSLNES